MEGSVAINIIKEGSWNKSQKDKMFELIAKAYNLYPKQLEAQINFLKFHL